MLMLFTFFTQKLEIELIKRQIKVVEGSVKTINKNGKITVSDVAKIAGVSASTVSRVISDNPRISQSTKEKVLKIMDELGYYPNANARSLARNKTGTIGVIMPTTSEELFLNPFFPEALRGIVKGASNTEYDLLLSTNTEKDEELKIIKSFIRGSKVDGLILMSSKIDDVCIEYLRSIDFPFSLIGSPHNFVDEINYVDNDNDMAAYELTSFLIQIGRKRIAMIAGDKSLMVTNKRVEGYMKALDANHIDFEESLLFTGSFDEETGYKYGKEISEMKDRPDALIVTDDLVAFGAVKLFESINFSIPEEIVVASFNNSILSRYSNTPLTSVDINAVELGRQSMNLLIEAMELGITGKRVIIPYKIHKRKSTEG